MKLSPAREAPLTWWSVLLSTAEEREREREKNGLTLVVPPEEWGVDLEKEDTGNLFFLTVGSDITPRFFLSTGCQLQTRFIQAVAKES